MTKQSKKTMAKAARQAIRKELTTDLASQLKDTVAKFDQGSKKISKEIDKAAKKLAKKLSAHFKKSEPVIVVSPAAEGKQADKADAGLSGAENNKPRRAASNHQGKAVVKKEADTDAVSPVQGGEITVD
ncbi:hypothetical protein [Hufsiella ginkgonis]|uniref:Uncharacterized protein n=1 Tax=Hufsiella ginkgonis TaxID=2695274 RepID=A0A7K1XZM9_9SPHI|nr:hypothetical protein [Hufsiella ginkgonis]MXV16475.1 hypothetical protein [Hufsiella ginkgonis]